MPDVLSPPLWMRRIVHAANLTPIVDLKSHVKAEAEELRHLLRIDGKAPLPQLQEALLSMHLKTDFLLQAMHFRPSHFDNLPDNADGIREGLTRAVTDLPRVLEEASEFHRGNGLHRVKVLCKHLLATMLALALIGTCPICHSLIPDFSTVEISDCH